VELFLWMQTKIYNYADVAYVGGGMATGLHNILEPAVFGIPIIIGENYDALKNLIQIEKIRAMTGGGIAILT